MESEWPAVPGECLISYGCYGQGYGAACTPRDGEYCGQLHYEMLVRDFGGRPGLLARAKRIDAFTRWKLARCGWLGEDHPLWLAEFFNGQEHEIRYGHMGR